MILVYVFGTLVLALAGAFIVGYASGYTFMRGFYEILGMAGGLIVGIVGSILHAWRTAAAAKRRPPSGT